MSERNLTRFKVFLHRELDAQDAPDSSYRQLCKDRGSLNYCTLEMHEAALAKTRKFVELDRKNVGDGASL